MLSASEPSGLDETSWSDANAAVSVALWAPIQYLISNIEDAIRQPPELFVELQLHDTQSSHTAHLPFG